VAFAPTLHHAEDIASKLADQGIMAGAGDCYAVRPLEAMGIKTQEGVVRLSFVHYTSRNEIVKMLNVLDSVL